MLLLKGLWREGSHLLCHWGAIIYVGLRPQEELTCYQVKNGELAQESLKVCGERNKQQAFKSLVAKPGTIMAAHLDFCYEAHPLLYTLPILGEILLISM